MNIEYSIQIFVYHNLKTDYSISLHFILEIKLNALTNLIRTPVSAVLSFIILQYHKHGVQWDSYLKCVAASINSDMLL